MSEEPKHAPYEWAEHLFRGEYDVAPKYRDMLAMLAATMMGNVGAAQHFYNRALVNGATDEELHRVTEIGRAQMLDVGDIVANVKRATEEARAARERKDKPADDEAGPPSPN